MADFYLEADNRTPEIKCPYCERGFYVHWNTEYGEASIGEHVARCTNHKCEKKFAFTVYLQYTTLNKKL